ncbi:MAG: 2-phospho-L-lactate guanylyltransferase [Halobacteriaceae archaeon]
MRVVVPFDAATPKTRLEGTLTAPERATLARAMLADVVEAVREAGGHPEILSTASVPDAPAPLTQDDRTLTEAVNAVLAEASDPVAIVMADLGLATPASITRLFETAGDVVLAPGRGGGTNAIVVRDTDFRVDYHGISIRDHRRIAAEIGATMAEVDSARLSTDVDEPADLPDLLLRGEGRAQAWLAERFRLAVTDGRVAVRRRQEPALDS